MKHFAILTISSLSLVTTIISAQEPETQNANEVPRAHKEITKISEAFGHLIGKNISSMGVEFDIQYVIKGLKDAAAGVNSPMSEMECIQAITLAQETAFKEQSEANMKAAEVFLKSNSSQNGIISLSEGKVQYKVEKEGEGEKIELGSTPLIRYVGKFIDGSEFGSSKEDEPISLDEIIPGLKAGLIGMKEGEKRTIYIHPDLGYGTRGALPPNSLLTFEIEIVKAQTQPLTDAIEIPTNPKGPSHEIAAPGAPIDHIR